MIPDDYIQCLLRLNRMLLDSSLSRAQFAEVMRLVESKQLTLTVAQQILDGTFRFDTKLPQQHQDKAKAVWSAIGHKIFGVNEKQYLNGTDNLEPVPQLPAWIPEARSNAFDTDILVDGRIVERIGLAETCRLMGVEYTLKHDDLIPHDLSFCESGIRWMRAQLGQRNANRKSLSAREAFANFEIGLDAVEGIFGLIELGKMVAPPYIDLVNCEPRGYPTGVGAIGISDGTLKLYWHWGNLVRPTFGAASRHKTKLSC